MFFIKLFKIVYLVLNVSCLIEEDIICDHIQLQFFIVFYEKKTLYVLEVKKCVKLLVNKFLFKFKF